MTTDKSTADLLRKHAVLCNAIADQLDEGVQWLDGEIVWRFEEQSAEIKANLAELTDT